MRPSFAALAAMILLPGCQSFQSQGYDVKSARDKDVPNVEHVLRAVATQTHLPKRSPAPYEYSPAPIAVYGDSRVQLLATRHRDYFHVEVIRYNPSGAFAFARIDQLVRRTLSRKFGNRLYVEPKPGYSHLIITE